MKKTHFARIYMQAITLAIAAPRKEDCAIAIPRLNGAQIGEQLEYNISIRKNLIV